MDIKLLEEYRHYKNLVKLIKDKNIKTFSFSDEKGNIYKHSFDDINDYEDAVVLYAMCLVLNNKPDTLSKETKTDMDILVEFLEKKLNRK